MLNRWCYNTGRYGVVSINPTASKIGVEVIDSGGNAVDAYIATQLALEALEPGWTGLGGGGFALVYFNGSVRFLDFRETAPLEVSKHVFTKEELHTGYKAIATPGMGRGLDELHREYGELGIDDIVKHVLKYLRKGLKVSKLFSHSLKIFRLSYNKVLNNRYAREKFLVNGRAPDEGVKLKLEGYINLLDSIKKEGFEVLYNGYAADIILKQVREGGGLLREVDLRRYTPVWRRVLKYVISDMLLYTSPPPSSGKLTVELYRRLSSKDDLINNVKWIQEARRLLQDPKYGVNKLYKYLKASRSTAHFSIYDRDGNAVSATSTIECFMGSGVLIDGLDILMNDEMHDFQLDNEINRLRGGARPASSMSPIILVKNEKPYLIIGASGGKRIFSALAQVLYNFLDRNMDLYKAVMEPRIHYDPGKEAYLVEDESHYRHLKRLGINTIYVNKEYPSPYMNSRSIMMGVVEAILIENDKVTGVSDIRKRCGAYIV